MNATPSDNQPTLPQVEPGLPPLPQVIPTPDIAPEEKREEPVPLPTPFELCQIAAALRGPKAGSKAVEATEEAMRLWFAAMYELDKAVFIRGRTARMA